MVMYRPPCSSSSGMRSIRRELQRRRSKPLAPTRSIAKKPSALASPPPPPRHGSSESVRDPLHRPPLREVRSSTTSHSRGSVVTDASPQSRPRASSRCITASPPPPPPRSVPSSVGSASRETPRVSARLRPGTVVGVRTRTTTLKTGQVLVLWLKATVVSCTSHGGYEVAYDGSRPSGDPKDTVRVPRHHVRVIKTTPSPTTPPPSLPRPTTATVGAAAQKKETLPAARPTTAGNSVRIIRSLFAEMERQGRAPLSGIGF